MPPKKPSPVTKTAPKTTTQKPVGRSTAAKPASKKPGTTAVKPGASGTKGAPTKKGSTSPSKTQAKGKDNAAPTQVQCVCSCQFTVSFHGNIHCFHALGDLELINIYSLKNINTSVPKREKITTLLPTS